MNDKKTSTRHKNYTLINFDVLQEKIKSNYNVNKLFINIEWKSRDGSTKSKIYTENKKVRGFE